MQNYKSIIKENAKWAEDLFCDLEKKLSVMTERSKDKIPSNVDENKMHGLAACMAKLPSRYRQVILLKYHQGFSCREIAKQLNITEANAIKLDQRAKNRLLQICKEEGIL